MSSAEEQTGSVASTAPKASKIGSSKPKKKKTKQTILSNAHPPAGASSPPPSSGSPASSASSSNTPCRFYNLGQCNKGNLCPFQHKKAAHFSPQACKFYTNGFCRNGDACPFSHDPKILESASAAKEPSIPGVPSIDDLVDLQDDPVSPEYAGSHDSSSFAGSFNDHPAFHDDSSSYQDTHDYFSRDSSSFEEEGLQAGANETFGLYGGSGTLYRPHSGSGPLETSANGNVAQGFGNANAQLHQLINPTTSPRTISSSRRSSSEFFTSSSYSSNSNSFSSESSPPPYVMPSPIHQAAPGGIKLSSRTAVPPTTTYHTLPPLPAPSGSPAMGGGSSMSSSPGPISNPYPGFGGHSHGGTRSPAFSSPLMDSPLMDSAPSLSSSISKPPFRRQSSAQMAHTSSYYTTTQQQQQNPAPGTVGSLISSHPTSALPHGASGPNLTMSVGTIGTQHTSTPSPSFHGRTGYGSVGTVAGPAGAPYGRPAPLNRSRSTDQGLLPQRGPMGMWLSEEEAAPAATFLSRVVPPLPSVSHLGSSNVSGSVTAGDPYGGFTNDDLASNGNITPTSTSSSSLMEGASLIYVSPRSRQSITSSNGGGARHGSSLGNPPSYLGDFDSFSELGTSDEDDYMFWESGQAWVTGGSGTSAPKALGGLGAPTVRGKLSIERAIEGLLEDDGDMLRSTSSQPSSASQTSESISAGLTRGSSNSGVLSTSSNSSNSSSYLSSSFNLTAQQIAARRSLLGANFGSATGALGGFHSAPRDSVPTHIGQQSGHASLIAVSNALEPSTTLHKTPSVSAIGPPSTNSTLSPSPSRGTLGSGTPIPMLSRTRQGSFSKSHEDLLANREAPLQSPLYNSASLSGFGFPATGSTSSALTLSNGTMIPHSGATNLALASLRSDAPQVTPSMLPTTPMTHSTQYGSNTAGWMSTAGATSNTGVGAGIASASVPMNPIGTSAVSSSSGSSGNTTSYGAAPKRAIPPMLGQLKSQSTARLNLPTSPNMSPSSSIGNANVVGPSRIPPKIGRLGKSQSETGPTISSSILAWKERNHKRDALTNQASHIAPGSLSLTLPPPNANGGLKSPGSDTPSSSAQASPSSTSSSRKQQLCMFFIEGNCKYNEACKFVHGLACPLCKKPCLFPDDPQQNEKHAKTCRLKIEIEESKDLTCALCSLKVVENNRKFGLLPDCDDIICVPCLKDYRTSTSKAECPVCQAPSHFLIPSHSFPQNPERKRELTEAFKLKMSRIPCKYFDHGNGVCKYGQHCHFHHNVAGAPTTSAGSTATEVPSASSSAMSLNMWPGNHSDAAATAAAATATDLASSELLVVQAATTASSTESTVPTNAAITEVTPEATSNTNTDHPPGLTNTRIPSQSKDGAANAPNLS